MGELDKDINNLKEIINLSKREIQNNDNNVTAILDITDLRSLKNVIDFAEEASRVFKHLSNKCED